MNHKWIGVVGWPLKHSLSKQYHEENIRKQGLGWEFRVLEWAPQNFERNILELKQDRTCIGFSVTMPFKEKIISYLDECEEFAQNVSSVNCVRNVGGKWHGTNTDAPGFLTHLNQWNPVPSKTVTIVVIGTGATGRCLSFALAQTGYQNFVLINRTFEKAQEWSEKLGCYFPDIGVEIGKWGDLSVSKEILRRGACPLRKQGASQDDIRMTNIFILNTTSLGMKGEELEWLDIAHLQNPVWLFDATYNPSETLLIRQCKSRCFYTMNGWPLFEAQARLAFKIWKS
ncbi:MAG: hypothetical protein HYY61_01765 [Deltaproteobacteria bacterium]|nr:hypothetical protein [Deltaproteobacteria bacterium]